MPALEFPSPPTLNQTFTGSNGIVYVYDGSKWSSLGATTISNETASVGAVAPTGPAIGTLWFDTAAQRLKVWYSGSWIDVRPSS